MKSSQNLTPLYVGALLLLGGAVTAWSAARPGLLAERAPMEAMLAADASGSAVTWDLPVTRNERVDDWIGFLQGANEDRTRLWLERSGRYGPLIRAELRRRGMPEDLLYLALIESGFSPRATSTAAAAGIWQFIAETGRRYGLQVNSEVDERRDPIRATSAALDYLEELHDRFGSWYLAAAAYNTGENRVERVLRERAGGARGNDSLFWRIAPHLPRETRNYVPLMLAAGHIGKEPARYGFDGLEYQDPLAYEVAWVPGATDLTLIAEAAGVELTDVVDLNPHLTKRRTPSGRGWAVRLPQGSRAAFTTGFPKLYRLAVEKSGATRSSRATPATKVEPSAAAPRVTSAGKATSRLHAVRRGENLSVIAARYDVSVKQLQRWNSLGSRSRIIAGQKLRVGA